jgi:hypothetical protein
MTLAEAARRLYRILSPAAPAGGLGLRFHLHGVAHSAGGMLLTPPLCPAVLHAARETATAFGVRRLLVGPLGCIACDDRGAVFLHRRRGARGTLIDRLEAPVGTDVLAQALARALRGGRVPVRFHVPDADLSAHDRLARARVLARIPGADADWLMAPMSMPWTAHPLRGAVAILSARVGGTSVPVALSTP